jgi:hypothetical protein
MVKRLAGRQRGIGLLGIMFWIAFVSGAVGLAAKLGPSYMQFATVKSVMNGIQTDPELVGKSPREISSALSKRLDVNSVRGVSEKDFKLVPAGSRRELVVAYEVREHVVANIDAVMAFNHRVALPAQ